MIRTSSAIPGLALALAMLLGPIPASAKFPAHPPNGCPLKLELTALDIVRSPLTSGIETHPRVYDLWKKLEGFTQVRHVLSLQQEKVDYEDWARDCSPEVPCLFCDYKDDQMPQDPKRLHSLYYNPPSIFSDRDQAEFSWFRMAFATPAGTFRLDFELKSFSANSFVLDYADRDLTTVEKMDPKCVDPDDPFSSGGQYCSWETHTLARIGRYEVKVLP